MYLSRLRLDPGRGARAETDRLLVSPYLLHQAVFAAFDPAERGEGRVMFRREPELREGFVVLLVQSQLQPDWERGFAQCLCAAAPAEVRPLEVNPRRGQRLNFRLRANPTRRTRGGERQSIVSGLGQPPSRDPLYHEAVLREMAEGGEPEPPPVRIREYVLERWLRRQLRGAAADLEFRITDEGLVREPSEREGGTGRPLEFKSVRYDGVLEVGDPDLLRKRVWSGIGTAKGFGFGLLSLAPAF